MSNTDRDPYSQGQLAAAVAVYLDAYHPFSTIDHDHDEADVEFEAALLQQGVISPSDTVHALIAYGTERRVSVYLCGHDTPFDVLADGTVIQSPPSDER